MVVRRIVGYLGTNFSGLQQQCGSGLRTVDDAVLKALAAANLIDSLNAAHASKNGTATRRYTCDSVSVCPSRDTRRLTICARLPT